MKHVIIGVGAAGIAAARTIVAHKPGDEVIMISEDEIVASRCMLHKYISGEREAETLDFAPDGFFENENVEWLGGISVTGIDASAGKVKCAGFDVGYDKLLIATGSLSSIPPVGALRTAKNVFGLRHFTDAKAIREAAGAAEKIVIIGGGLVGLDAAYALHELRKDISIVDIAKRILTINLDEKAAGEYESRFAEAGCKFYLGLGVSDTKVDESGDITAIVLSDDTVLPCDMVIVAAGVRPATALVEGSGIECERAIKVDERLATSCAGVYAAGDAAGLSGIWPNAMRQGTVAALNMCGVESQYTDTFAVKNTVNFFGLVTLSVGALEPEEGDTVITQEDRGTYKKFILRDGCVAGVILQGDIKYSGFWQYLIKNRIKVDCIGKPIWKLSYADFCKLSETGEYIW